MAPIFSQNAPTPIVLPTAPTLPAPPPNDSILASRLGTDLREIPIYDSELAADWSLDQSDLIRIDATSRRYVHQSPFAIEAVPQSGYGRLFFTVRRDARAIYEHNQILGVRLWINGGPNGVGPEDLIFTTMGSNAYPYWRPDDTSVRAAGRITDDGTIFDEQRLYFLGFEEGIPANTWAEVIIWLDERILDPEYTYLTGIYIKNDEFFVKPFYVDSVSLLVPRR